MVGRSAVFRGRTIQDVSEVGTQQVNLLLVNYAFEHVEAVFPIGDQDVLVQATLIIVTNRPTVV